jgi:hypothetical protein
MSRIVFTVARGRPKYGRMAMALARSLDLIGDTTPRAVLTDLDGFDWTRRFAQVLKPKGPRSALDKLVALEDTDADHVLSIDSDSLAFRRLEPIFEALRGKPFVVVGHRSAEGLWHGADRAAICRERGVESLPAFNGGLIYYERHPDAQALIARAREIEGAFDTTGFERFRGGASEEVCVALAMVETGLGEIVPDETEFMNTAVGLIGPLRMNVLEGECSFVCRRHAVRRVRPFVFHAARYVNFVSYWKQVECLEWLERYEDRHPPGYMSPWQKLERSVQRRYLRWFRGRG